MEKVFEQFNPLGGDKKMMYNYPFFHFLLLEIIIIINHNTINIQIIL